MTINIECTKVAVRTKGNGHWKKYTYQDAEFNITLSGLLVFDEANWTGWDNLDNQFNFNHVLCRVSFDDQNGDVRTVQGYIMIESSALKYSAGDVVKDDIQLQGNGKLDMFDGFEPCPTVITAITVDGQEDDDGIVHVSYTYTGEAYQIKYRIDNTGDYIYAVADLTLNVPGLTVAPHIIEIIPVCVNGYEGTGMSQDFVVTQGMTCTSTIDGYFIHTPDSSLFSGLGSGVSVVEDSASNYILPHLVGVAALYGYDWDGSGLFTVVPAGTQIPLTGLSAGAHQLSLVPICQFDGGARVNGIGITRGFTLNSQPAQSKINYSYANFPPGNTLNIYVNGTLVIAKTVPNGTGSITAPTGATIKAVLASSAGVGARVGTLTVTNNTTSTQLANLHAVSPFTKQFSFTANGDEFTITGVVSA